MTRYLSVHCITTNFTKYRQSSAYTVLYQHGFLNYTVYFGALICPFSTKSLLHLHGCFSKVSKNSVSRGPPVQTVWALLRRDQCRIKCVLNKNQQKAPPPLQIIARQQFKEKYFLLLTKFSYFKWPRRIKCVVNTSQQRGNNSSQDIFPSNKYALKCVEMRCYYKSANT